MDENRNTGDMAAGGEVTLAGQDAKRLFLAVMLTSFIGPFAASGVNVIVPELAREFISTANELNWVVFGYLLGSAMFTLPAGKLADIYGYRRIYMTGLWLFAATFLVAGLANNILVLNIIRFLQGSVLSLIFGPGMALLIASHSPKERGRVIGYSAAATYGGLSLGPVLCGFLCELVSWRSIFVLTGCVALIGVWLMSGIKQEWFGDKGAGIDFKGSLCYLVAAPLLLCGLTKISDGYFGATCLGIGFLGMLAFLFIETKVKYPCLDIKIFKGNWVFTCSNLAAMLHYSSTFALSFLLSLYLQLIVGFSASTAGAIILFQPVVMALLSPKAGALSDRISPTKVAPVGMAITSSGLWAMSFLTQDTPIWLVIVVLMWIGLGFALFSAPNNNAIMGAVDKKYYGTASSLLSTMRLFGQSTSMALVTMIMALCQVQSLTGSDNVQLLHAIQTAFTVFGSVSLAGVVMSAVRNKVN